MKRLRETHNSANTKKQPRTSSEQEQPKPQSSETEQESAEEAAVSEDSSDDLVQQTTLRPYDRLLQSLQANAAPQSDESVDQNEEPPDQDDRDGDDAEQDEDGETDSVEAEDETSHAGSTDPFVHFGDFDEDSEPGRRIQAVQRQQYTSEKIAIDSSHAYTCCTVTSAMTYDYEKFIKKRLLAPCDALSKSPEPCIQALTQVIFQYRDVLYPLRSVESAADVRGIVSLHALNHVLKNRDTVLKHNERLSSAGPEADLEFRDQGFTRPKILIILPTRQSAVRYVHCLIDAYQPEQQENKQRFLDQFHRPSAPVGRKGRDFEELFGGNDNDLFRIGIKFTRKTMKFFSQFYASDIILASPLGLKLAIGEDSKTADSDFLSSIEVLVLDQCDALSMQNWEHVSFILEQLNQQPKAAHDCDFARVKHWYLDQRARYVRQTVCISAYNFPALNRIFTSHMLNLDGKCKFGQVHSGIMLELPILFSQTFLRFTCSDPMTEPDARFEHFCASVLPTLLKPSRASADSASGVVLFVPGYADFVRLRNHFATELSLQHVAVGSISEYTPPKEASRGRSHFASGRTQILLYSERMHHFHRSTFAGAKSIVMYGLPENPQYYVDLVDGFLGVETRKGVHEAKQATVRTLFCRLDALKLERVVGSSRVQAMLRPGNADIFSFAQS